MALSKDLRTRIAEAVNQRLAAAEAIGLSKEEIIEIINAEAGYPLEKTDMGSIIRTTSVKKEGRYYSIPAKISSMEEPVKNKEKKPDQEMMFEMVGDLYVIVTGMGGQFKGRIKKIVVYF